MAFRTNRRVEVQNFVRRVNPHSRALHGVWTTHVWSFRQFEEVTTCFAA